jgi:hypothetical protein
MGWGEAWARICLACTAMRAADGPAPNNGDDGPKIQYTATTRYYHFKGIVNSLGPKLFQICIEFSGSAKHMPRPRAC